MSKKMMLLVASLVLSLSALLGTGLYFGKKYVDENYVILNQEEQATLSMQVHMYGAQAYQAGKQTCSKGV